MLNPDNPEFAVTHDNEIAYILSKFDDDYIYTAVSEALQVRLKYYQSSSPNIVQGYEFKFIQLLGDYTYFKPQIIAKRTEVYENIVKLICDYYNFSYQDYDNYDLYSSALYMYDMFISNFQNCVVAFFYNYICKEKNGLYEGLNLEQMRKNKTISNSYYKATMGDNAPLAAICSNIEYVVQTIANMDISFEDYLKLSLQGVELGDKIFNHISAVLSPIDNFMASHIKPVIEGPYGFTIIESIKLIISKSVIPTNIAFEGELPK